MRSTASLSVSKERVGIACVDEVIIPPSARDKAVRVVTEVLGLPVTRYTLVSSIAIPGSPGKMSSGLASKVTSQSQPPSGPTLASSSATKVEVGWYEHPPRLKVPLRFEVV